MKRKFAFIATIGLAILFAVSCNSDDNDPDTEIVSGDETLPSVQVTQPAPYSPYYKLFVVNEGNFGMNNATLDFLRFKDGNYVRGAFRQMNPNVAGGLGDTANDAKVFLNSLWILMNNSGLVQVLNPVDETVLKDNSGRTIGNIQIPSPRRICFDYYFGYAYVTSYDGAVYDGVDKKGSLYRISLSTLEVVDKIEVGYQPEGVCMCDSYIYVANSGGFHYAATGEYDNTVTVISRSSFTKVQDIEVAPNLREITSDGYDWIYVTGQGDFSTEHSGIYKINGHNNTVMDIPALKDVRVTTFTELVFNDGSAEIYIIGTDDEFDWDKYQKDFNFYKINMQSSYVEKTSLSGKGMSVLVNPYGMAVNGSTGEIYVCDALDYIGPGIVYGFTKDFTLSWQADAGAVCGHPVLYAPVY